MSANEVQQKFQDQVVDNAQRAEEAPTSMGWGEALLHRWPTAVGIAIGALLVVVGVDEGVGFAVASISLALEYLIIGAIRKDLHGPGMLTLQIIGALFFGGLALASLFVDREMGRYLVATVWLTHAIWDFFHHRADRVVPRWYAEFCAVVDIIVGVSILLLP